MFPAIPTLLCLSVAAPELLVPQTNSVKQLIGFQSYHSLTVAVAQIRHGKIPLALTSAHSVSFYRFYLITDPTVDNIQSTSAVV
jgi:hypothetical protein